MRSMKLHKRALEAAPNSGDENRSSNDNNNKNGVELSVPHSDKKNTLIIYNCCLERNCVQHLKHYHQKYICTK